MLTRKCCCGDQNVCCESWLTDQFVTIFAETMASAVPVSTGDLISLKINRPSSRTKSRELSSSTLIPCKKCCTPAALDACDVCPLTRQCEDCPQGGQKCVPGNQVPAVDYLTGLGGSIRNCCTDFCGGCSELPPVEIIPDVV